MLEFLKFILIEPFGKGTDSSDWFFGSLYWLVVFLIITIITVNNIS